MPTIPEQLATLQSEVIRLSNLIRTDQPRSLTEEQIGLRRKLNTLNSPINRLPFETISIIFLNAISPPSYLTSKYLHSWESRRSQNRDVEELFFSVTLSAVCSLWREVALSTPQLWTHFEYPECLWKPHKVDCRYLLPLYLLNSKHFPIHLSLEFPEDPDDSFESILWHPSFDRILRSNLSRIHTLSLHNPSACWFSQLKALTFVVDLSIGWIDWSPCVKDRLHLQKCHALSRLSLHNAIASDDTRIIYQVPSSCTVLDLSGIPLDICVKTMLRCPNLVEAYIREQQDWHDHAIESQLKEFWFRQPVVYRHLKVLLWDRYQWEETWADVFLQHLRTPALQTLILMDSSHLEMASASPGEMHFISQLPPSLKTFGVGEVPSIDVDSFGRLVNQQSSIENLTISKCDIELLTGIFQALRSPPPANEDNQSDRMPLLKSLSIAGCCSDEETDWIWELPSSKLDPLISALELRLSRRDTFRLELSGFGVDWTPVAQERLRNLVRKGVQLEVIEDFEPVDWLREN